MGLSQGHVAPWQDEINIHKEVFTPLSQLRDEARKAGFSLEVASGFRSFDRQLALWNAKARGERTVLDEQGMPVVPGSLDEDSLMWAILRWSALPGTSRHHWGTDMDIWDKAAVNDSYKLKLEVPEYTGDGPFAPMIAWLESRVFDGETEFYFPYQSFQGGVMPEPWHISFRPLANNFAKRLTVDLVHEQIRQTDICLKQVILKNIEEIMDRFVLPC